jgi:cytochrome oxidase Cu insertion factor (SCO1/SenC/PrrC family)
VNSTSNPPANPLNAQRRSRLMLGLLATLFFGPVVVAAILYYIAPGYRPDGRTNYGTLVDPARPLPAFALVDADGRPQPELLLGKWSLIQLGGGVCDTACAERLLQIRQLRLALGKDLNRMQRIYVAPDTTALAAMRAEHAAEHPDARFLADTGPAGGRVADFFQPQDANAIYLVDPNGNWLMVYTGSIESKRMLKDLKTLMRLSSIG